MLERNYDRRDESIIGWPLNHLLKSSILNSAPQTTWLSEERSLFFHLSKDFQLLFIIVDVFCNWIPSSSLYIGDLLNGIRMPLKTICDSQLSTQSFWFIEALRRFDIFLSQLFNFILSTVSHQLISFGSSSVCVQFVIKRKWEMKECDDSLGNIKIKYPRKQRSGL